MKTITALTQDPLGYRTSRSQILAVRDFFLKVNQAKKVLLAGRMKQNDAFLGGKNAVLVISPPRVSSRLQHPLVPQPPKYLILLKKRNIWTFPPSCSPCPGYLISNTPPKIAENNPPAPKQMRNKNPKTTFFCTAKTPRAGANAPEEPAPPTGEAGKGLKPRFN